MGDSVHQEIIPRKKPFVKVLGGKNQGKDEQSGLSCVPCLPAEVVSLLRTEGVHMQSGWYGDSFHLLSQCHDLFWCLPPLPGAHLEPHLLQTPQTC